MIFSQKFAAGIDLSSYDAEGVALLEGLAYTSNHIMTKLGAGRRVGVFTDSQSWCTKFSNMDPSEECETLVFNSLNSIAKFNKIGIRHVKSHNGIIWNDA